MITHEQVQQSMYAIFNETDAVRQRIMNEVYTTAESTGIPISDVCKIMAKLLLSRILSATTSEEARDYITELVTVVSIHRAELDAAQGLTDAMHARTTPPLS